MNTTKTDVLVVGGGTAALRAAVAAAQAGADTLVLQKGTPNLGIVAFNAPVPDAGDTPAQFFTDMVNRGQFLVDYEKAAFLTNNALEEVKFLEGQGLHLTHHGGGYHPRQTSGNTVPRTIYTTDRTGPQILSILRRILREANIPIHMNQQVVRLLVKEQRVIGAIAVDLKTETLEAYLAKAVILATGGLGPLYAVSNNHPHLAGDGYVLAYQAGAQLIDMEFVQFEPFTLRLPEDEEPFTISFLLDDNPRITNSDGQEFLPTRAVELSKDRLSRALFAQIQAGKGGPKGGIFYDATEIPREKLEIQERFLVLCRRAGLDPFNEPFEVGPSQHYLCGGVKIDANGHSSLEGLFAAGEAAGGVHGADRLAGNSGTDVLVFGARAGRSAAGYAQAQAQDPPAIDLDTESQTVEAHPAKDWDPDSLAELNKELRRVMWDHVGVIREGRELAKAWEAIQALKGRAANLGADNVPSQVQLFEMDGKLSLAEMICRGAILRRESRGVHYRSDYPDRDDVNWLKHIVYQKEATGLHTHFQKPGGDLESDS